MNPQTSSHSARPPVTAPLDRAPVIVIIPAWNEEGSIGRVIDALPASHFTEVVVADNNSTDFTAEVARKFGATVVPATRQGYGSACLAGLAYVAALPPERQPRAIVFIDADFSDHPEQLPDLVDPILAGETDFVIGSRMLLEQPRGALLPQAVFGNKLACFLMWLLWRAKFTDLGPFRAIGWKQLQSLNMVDTNFGWTVEMQIKAARAGLRCREVPVRYRPRIGLSKITGTLSGTFRAGYKILYTIARYSLSR
jgi:glycosyltransferase involved in cell wall biosynthesis